VTGRGLAGGAVGEVRVRLDLVDGRRDAGLCDDALEVGGLEVRDPGGPQSPSETSSVMASQVET
jgi:hypothetical protein